MKSKAIQFLEANQSGDRSTFVDDAKWRRDNAAWLKLSHRISYAIMDYMQDNHKTRNDVAEELGVSPQFVSKILSGSQLYGLKGVCEMGLMNFQDWVVERQRLLERIKELEAENAELRKRLGEDVVPIKQKPTAMQTLSLQEKVDLFRSLFKGREDV